MDNGKISGRLFRQNATKTEKARGPPTGSLTALTATGRGSGLLAVPVEGLPLYDLLVGVDDPGEVVAGLQDVP